MRTACGALCGAAALFVIAPASAAPQLDQADSAYNSETAGYEVGQSFTAGVTGQLSSIFLYSYFPSYNNNTVRVDIYNGNDLLPGNLLASGTVNPTITGNGFSLSTSPLLLNLVAGQQYTFDVTELVHTAFAENITLDLNNKYAGGAAYLNGQSYAGSGYDLGFQTFTSASITVTEPASMAMLGVGITGMMAARRRRMA